jgi:hypothetical protein
MTNPRPSMVAVMAAALPAAIATLAVVVFAVFELFGHTLFSQGPDRNLAEAAAMGRLSEVVRLLAAGEDPNQIVTVRPHVISSSVTRVTALEASVWHRSVAQMALFDRAGSVTSPATRQHLMCLAADLRVDEIVHYYAAGQPPDCVPEQALTMIVARSQQPTGGAR